MRTENQKAWFFVLPVLFLVAFNALVPMMTVVNYSVQETFGDNIFFWQGLDWFEQILRSDRFQAALGRQFLFTAIILAIEVPLGIAVALTMPRKGPWVPVCLVLMALPMLIPWNVVGSMWNIFALPKIGMLGYFMNDVLGIAYDMTQDPLAAWITSSSWMSGTGPRSSCSSATPASSRSPTPITRPPASTAPPTGPSSATSSSRR